MFWYFGVGVGFCGRNKLSLIPPQNRALNLALEREKTSVQQLKKELIAAREQRPSADREGDSSGFARDISTPSSTAAPTSTEEQLAEAKAGTGRVCGCCRIRPS